MVSCEKSEEKKQQNTTSAQWSPCSSVPSDRFHFQSKPSRADPANQVHWLSEAHVGFMDLDRSSGGSWISWKVGDHWFHVCRSSKTRSASGFFFFGFFFLQAAPSAGSSNINCRWDVQGVLHNLLHRFQSLDLGLVWSLKCVSPGAGLGTCGWIHPYCQCGKIMQWPLMWNIYWW